ncbi:hypothetical protein CR513_35803, partial [Mucuna pruriens]
MVILVIIAGCRVERVLVDQGNSANVLFWSAFQKLGFSDSSLEECLGTLIGFTGRRGKYIMPFEQMRIHLLELDPRFDREDTRLQLDEDLKEI